MMVDFADFAFRQTVLQQHVKYYENSIRCDDMTSRHSSSCRHRSGCIIAAPPEAVVAPTVAVVASPAAAVVAAAPPATVVTVFTVHTISSAIVD